jgi:hypothetical protein
MASLGAIRLLCAVLAVSAIPVLAWAADPFQVSGIEVDVTAANVAAAKDKAIADAEREGFRRLLERLTQPADHGRLPKADPIQYVRDVAIEQEKSSTVRYIATLSVRYNAASVKKLLQGAGLKYADPRPRPVAVVPLYRAGGRALLWDDPNPWRAAWALVGNGALVPLAIPSGDLADVQSLPTDKAMAADGPALAAFAQRYRTSDVLLATAMVNAAGSAIEVTLGGSAGIPKPYETKTYPIGEAGPDAALKVAALDIAQGLDATYKQQNLLAFDRAASLPVMVALKGLDDWVAVRERLGRVPQVRRWEIVSLSRDEAAIVINTLGEPDQVKGALANAGLVLEQGEGFWTMRPR